MELRRTIKDKESFESGLSELTKFVSKNELEYKSKAEELLEKVELIQSSLVESEKNCSIMLTKFEFESARVKEKDSKIEELLN